MTRPDTQTVERVAQQVFEAMRFAAEEGAPQGMSPPKWASGGNSDMQNVARQYARAAIAALPDTKALEVADEIERLREALESIAKWKGEFPDTGEFWKDGSPVSYGAKFGSNGERDFMREKALAALSTQEKAHD